jgi:hypothetical protein
LGLLLSLKCYNEEAKPECGHHACMHADTWYNSCSSLIWHGWFYGSSQDGC